MGYKTDRLQNDHLIIYLEGRLDAHMSLDVEAKIAEVLDKYISQNVILNMKEVDYISSSGLRIIVSFLRDLTKEKRKLKLCNLNKSVLKVFEVVELLDMFDIYSSEKKALKS